ncbi:hypothetical protein CEXT_725661 [Caerostris extrusa]|uniref:Uncharacterized protein n=1 Tax=Caerostris extrusa TaxID=172846 RepID=A0AAV4X318_CAEEX|nr:hypothetical protein CEXT_725661 [Caerostris extrusa]
MKRQFHLSNTGPPTGRRLCIEARHKEAKLGEDSSPIHPPHKKKNRRLESIRNCFDAKSTHGVDLWKGGWGCRKLPMQKGGRGLRVERNVFLS